MALVRVYCGLASVGHAAPPASAAPMLVAAVVDDAGRLLDVRKIGDDPAGYAQLGAMLVERSSGPSGPAVATDSDEYLVTGLLTAAGRPLAVVDDDLVDDFAERFADDQSQEEMASPQAERKAIGLARALQAGALSAVALPAPRDLAGFKPVLTAHAALANGRHAAAIALREVLRELYPAALRAYPDPAERVSLAVLDALPEPGMLAGPGTRGRDSAVIAHLVADGVADEQTVGDAVTALRVAIAETPRRPVVDKALTAAVAETVQQAVAAVRACDAGCAGLVATLTSRMTTTRTTTAPPAGRRPAAADPTASASTSAAALYAVHAGAGGPARTGAHTPRSGTRSGASDKTGRREGALPAASHSPAVPRPVATPPTAPHPATPAAARSSSMAPVSAPPRQTPPANPVSPVSPAAPTARPAEPPANRPTSAPPPPPGITPTRRAVPPVDAGEPFRATLTTAAINSARAERQRMSFPAKARTNGEPRPSNGISATDLTIPVPAPRPSADAPPPGSRANWPLVNSGEDDRANGGVHEPGYSLEDKTPADFDLSADPGNNGRITPPWLADDLPPEPPMLRLVESPPLADPASLDEPALMDDRRADASSARLSAPRPPERDGRGARSRRSTVEPSGPPVTDEADGDLLIFAATRSAWFTGQDDESDVHWSSIADSGWRAAEQAAHPRVGDETKAGLPKRVPQANLVPGSPLREKRPLEIVRDAASMAANTMGYFQGWRRGQEIGGYAVGGRPGRESAGGWEFQRDDDDRDDSWDHEYRSVGYRS